LALPYKRLGSETIAKPTTLIKKTLALKVTQVASVKTLIKNVKTQYSELGRLITIT
jgi:hypothetical protein